MKLHELTNDHHAENNKPEANETDEAAWDAWDKQIEADLKSGKLQPVIEEALNQEGEPL